MPALALDASPETLSLIVRYQRALRYELRLQEARDDFLTFCQVMMPGDDPDNIDDTAFTVAAHHRYFAGCVQQVDAGKMLKSIFNTPPRHGKTHMMNTMFSAWRMGRRPHEDVMVATYNQEMAEETFSTLWLALVNSDRFRQVFPEFALNPDRNSAGHRQTAQGGNIYFLGRRSPTTGRGGHCFPAGTKVLTDLGLVDVVAVAAMPCHYKLLTYDIALGGLGYASIKAVSSRQANGLRRITSAGGRVVTATRCHPFFSGGGWVEAGALAPGDPVVCAVRSDVRADGLRLPEVDEARRPAVLLDQVLWRGGEREAVRREEMHGLRGAGAEGDISGNGPDALLLGGMQEGDVRPAESGDAEAKHADVHDLPEGLRGRGVDAATGASNVQPGMRIGDALSAHVGRRQSEVEARRDGASTEACGQGVPDDAHARLGARRPSVRDLSVGSKPARAPHRRGADEQFLGKSGDAVLVASSPLACGEGWEAVHDTVAVVEDLCDEQAVVFDFQVDPTHNFFAEGFLVHNCIIVDDPIKDDKEARYESARNDAWDWFRKTLYTRRHNERCPIMVIQTRWTADDITGRISDPANLHYTEEFGSDFQIINIPAIAVSKNDVMGRKIGEALWPEKFGTEELLKIRAADPVGFSCLYQNDPIPDEGVLFQPADLLEYDREELARLEPAMRIYCFSDHAYGTEKIHDPSCFAPVGVAPNGDAYFLPDIFWDRASPDDAIEKMMDMMVRRNPQRWFPENGGIFKTLEPFLTARMRERNIHCSIEPVWPKGTRKGQGKTERVASALARCRMGRVKFPSFASWWPRAKAELLAFPNGNNDDFVDVLSLVGLQLDRIHARRLEPVKPKPQGMTWDWLMGEHERGPLDTRGWTGRA